MALRFDDDSRRIAYKKALNERRTNELLHSGKRTFGIDKKSLDEMVASKKAMKDAELRADRELAQRESQIRNLIAAREAEESVLINEERRQIKKQWDEQTIFNRSKKISERKEAIIPENCGKSSVQLFSGEDRERDVRVRMQSMQLKQWADQQIEEGRNRKEAERAGDKEYAAYIQAVDGARTSLEVEDANRSVLEMSEVSEENRRLAREKREYYITSKKNNDKIDLEDLERSRLEPTLAETLAYGAGDKGDFRGLSRDELRELRKQNTLVAVEQRERMENEKAKETQWGVHEKEVRMLVSAAEVDDAQARRQAAMDLAAAHSQQREEAREREAKARAQARGEVTAEFFQGFGTSLR